MRTFYLGLSGFFSLNNALQGLQATSEADVIKKVMLKETVDGEFTTVQDVAEVALLFAGFGSSALTGQSLVVSHGWFMQ